MRMTNEDIKLLHEYLTVGVIDSKALDKITKKLDIIVKQMEANETYNKTITELNAELDKIK